MRKGTEDASVRREISTSRKNGMGWKVSGVIIICTALVAMFIQFIPFLVMFLIGCYLLWKGVHSQ